MSKQQNTRTEPNTNRREGSAIVELLDVMHGRKKTTADEFIELVEKARTEG